MEGMPNAPAWGGVTTDGHGCTGWGLITLALQRQVRGHCDGGAEHILDAALTSAWPGFNQVGGGSRTVLDVITLFPSAANVTMPVYLRVGPGVWSDHPA
jgi:hypothetical protein